MKKLITMILALLMCLSLLVACNDGSVTAEEAQKIALEYSDLKASDVYDIHTHIIDQNGSPCYQTYMTTEKGKITVVIGAASGVVCYMTVEHFSEDEAKTIALQDAGLLETEVRDLEVDLDSDDGICHYDVNFEKDGYDYAYEIAVESGKILKSRKERD